MSKPFFYRITAADFLAAVVIVPECDRAAWVLSLALDMVSGDVDKAKSEFAKDIINEAGEFSDKKRAAANKRWSKSGKQSKAEDMQTDAVHMHSNASSSTEAVTVTEQSKPKHLSDKSNAYTEDFLEFWSQYPKKTGKGAAYKSWKKEKPNIETVIQSLLWQRESEQWQTGFIPLPTTYLNQRRWEDEPEEGSRKSQHKSFTQMRTDNTVKAMQDFVGGDDAGSRQERICHSDG